MKLFIRLKHICFYLFSCHISTIISLKQRFCCFPWIEILCHNLSCYLYCFDSLVNTVRILFVFFFIDTKYAFCNIDLCIFIALFIWYKWYFAFSAIFLVKCIWTFVALFRFFFQWAMISSDFIVQETDNVCFFKFYRLSFFCCNF